MIGRPTTLAIVLLALAACQANPVRQISTASVPDDPCSPFAFDPPRGEVLPVTNLPPVERGVKRFEQAAMIPGGVRVIQCDCREGPALDWPKLSDKAIEGLLDNYVRIRPQAMSISERTIVRQSNSVEVVYSGRIAGPPYLAKFLASAACTAQLTVIAPREEDMGPGSDHRAWITGLRLKTTMPPPSGGSSASSRLEELKRLLDRNLITPAEYETRRKAILDSI